MSFGAPQQDLQLQPPPGDTVQSLSWSPMANFLVGGSWDNSVRCWEVQPTGQAQMKAEQKMDGPVLDCVWHADGSKVLAASCDRTVKLWDLQANKLQQVAAHDAPVKVVRYIPSLNCIMTGSWDRTLKFWDLRSPQPVASFNLPERCYAGDVSGPLAVIATAQRHVIIYSLQGGPKEFRRTQSNLKMQTRCLSCFPSSDGFAIGSIEGRVAIHYAEEAVAKKDNFSFKCHRDDKTIYCVNDIDFHPQFGTFATVGSDKKYSFWDKNQRSRLKLSSTLPAQITACKFNRDGTLFGYALGYDWSMGHEHHNPSAARAICVHPCQESEVKPKGSRM